MHTYAFTKKVEVRSSGSTGCFARGPMMGECVSSRSPNTVTRSRGNIGGARVRLHTSAGTGKTTWPRLLVLLSCRARTVGKRARMRRDWAATQRTGRGARPAEEKHNKIAPQTKTSALVAPRSDAITDWTTTYSAPSAVSDPSELGSEPDSWL